MDSQLKTALGKSVGILATVVVLGCFWQFVLYPNMPWKPNPDLNPDKSHTHADFSVWINGRQLSFTDDKYMSGLSYDDSTHDEAGEYLHQFLHLHDNVGHVLHRHAPGLDLAEFFGSIGFTFTDDCFVFDDGESHCNEDGVSQWSMYLNDKQVEADPGYVFKDGDRVLLTYGSLESEIKKQLRRLPDDACLYSQTCPWRGEPPAENCIADPSIPCGGGGLDLEDSLF